MLCDVASVVIFFLEVCWWDIGREILLDQDLLTIMFSPISMVVHVIIISRGKGMGVPSCGDNILSLQFNAWLKEA